MLIPNPLLISDIFLSSLNPEESTVNLYENRNSKSANINRKGKIYSQTKLQSYSHFLKLIYNFETDTCWLIAILHNIRANCAFKNYILNNCTNDEFKKGLENMLNAHKQEIARTDLNAVISEYGIDYENIDHGGDSCKFLKSLLKYIYNIKIGPHKIYERGKEHLFSKGNQDSEYIYPIYEYVIRPTVPHITINLDRQKPITGYLNISNALRGIPNHHRNSDNKVPDSVIFHSSPDYFILSIENSIEYIQGNSKFSFNISGITIDTYVYITTKGRLEKQKYALTGITVREVEINSLSHIRAFIKSWYTWYDTDYETLKEYKKDKGQMICMRPLFVDDLNKKDQITIDYEEYENKYVTLLFYQRV